MGKIIVPPLITMFILLTIICIEVIAGAPLTKEQMKPSVNEAVYTLGGMNQSENTIINMLLFGREVADKDPSIEETNEYDVYIQTLMEYLITSEVDIRNDKANQIFTKIKDLNNIMILEHKISFQEMSLDGKELALQLAKEIYALCGLKISFDLQGSIICISDQSNYIFYQNKSPLQQAEFQLNILLIILLVMILLFAICVAIAKKNQLFCKEGEYDALKKKEYA